MKIVQFVEAFGGGVYTYVKDLCNFLIENDTSSNLEVYLIYSPNRDEFNKSLFLKEINPKVKLFEIKMVRDINPKIDYLSIKKTRDILKKINPDVIHLHSAKATVLGRISSFNIVPRNKIFYSPHGYSFVQQNISNSKKLIFKCIEKVMPLMFGGTTIASGNTEFEISKKYGNSILINNGVDFKLPNSIVKHTTNKKLTIGTVGRLSDQKNPALFNQIAEKLPDYNFIWIGDGELKDDIKSDNIEVTGWIKTREELLHKINQLDIYIQVSLWEGLPISILEAMALKKPLLVTDVIGNRDTVKESYNGFKFKNANEAIDLLKQFEDVNLRNRMSENSYIFCDSDFNLNKNFQKLIGVYLK